MQILVGIDRDNTINHDREGFFGRKDNYKDELEFVEGAIEGLKSLSENANTILAVLSNQIGVAKGVLTEKRVIEVNSYIQGHLSAHDVDIDYWAYCPYIDRNGAKLWEQKRVSTIDYNYVLNETDQRLELLKPNPGMLTRTLNHFCLNKEKTKIFMIGDRISDVLAGLNSGGSGILVHSPEIQSRISKHDSTKQIKELLKDRRLKGRVYVVESISEAADIINKN